MGYAAFVSDAPGQVVNLLNQPTFTMVKSRFITARTILAELGIAGAIILEKLSGFVALDPTTLPPEAQALRVATKWAMRFIESEGLGIDIGHPNTVAILDGLQAAGVLTIDEANAAKGLAIQPASRLEVLVGEGTQMNETLLREALNGNV